MFQIPSKIHFIWLGGPIRPEYLKSILELASIVKRSPGFELCLWVDDEKNIHSTLLKLGSSIDVEIMTEYLFSGDRLYKQLGISLRNINELKTRMIGPQADQFYDDPQKALLFWQSVNIEEL